MVTIRKIYNDTIKYLKENSKDFCTYHDYEHTIYVFKKCRHIASKENISEQELFLIQTAALFHDIAQTESPIEHEKNSCRMAKPLLEQYGFTPKQIESINGMIMATKIPQRTNNKLENVIADADLIYLGTNQFRSQAEGLYHEMKHFNPELTHKQWDKIQVDFIEKHHYHTDFCKKYYEPRKQRNLAQLKREAKIK